MSLRTRQRAGSLKQAIDDINTDTHGPVPATTSSNGTHSSNGKHTNGLHSKKSKAKPDPYDPTSQGLWKDMYTMRWMRVQKSALTMLSVPIVLWAAWELLARADVVSADVTNPFSRLLFVSHSVVEKDGSVGYRKGPYDFLFIGYWVVCFSFLRLFWIKSVFQRWGRHLGLRSAGKDRAAGKDLRFGEQGYFVVYFTIMGSFGVYVMKHLPTWYFNCTPQWTDYPQWAMSGPLKSYYLLHFSFWVQQFAVLALRLEKPRKDQYELIAHHTVTLWLIGWSYLVNMTWIGNMVFVTMDWPDVVFAITKMYNYLEMEKTSAVALCLFVVSWVYGRHYINLYLLYSIWTEFDKIPAWTRKWSPSEGVWLAPWMRYQIFIPLMLLQIINLFWLYRILRVVNRALFQDRIVDERSDDEDDDEGKGADKDE